MAFVEDEHEVLLAQHLVEPGLQLPALLGDTLLGRNLEQGGELLDGGDDDAALGVENLATQDVAVRVGVGATLLEAVVLLHGLVVEVLAIDDEEHLLDAIDVLGELCGLERGERLARACGVPDEAACADGALPMVVEGGLDAQQDLLGGSNLIGTHHKELLVGVEDAVAREDAQDGMLGKEGLREVGEFGQEVVLLVAPVAGELEAVALVLLLFDDALLPLLLFLHVGVAGSVAVVLGLGTIADDEDLHIVVEAAARPEGVALIAVDLVEGFLDAYAACLEFDVDEGQAVDEDGDVVAVLVDTGEVLVLVDDLELVLEDVARLVDEVDVEGGSVLAGEREGGVLLDHGALVLDAKLRGGDFGEDLFPFGVGIDLVVELLQAQAQVVEQLLLGMNGEVFISLVLQLLDERLFEFGFALVGGVA